MSSSETWVIIGAGASGSAFAHRAATHPTRRLIVIEAGPVPELDSDTDREVWDANNLLAATPGHPLTGSHRAILTDQKPYDIVRGEVFGGSTAINGTYCVRPPETDFHRFHELVGDSFWSAEAFLASAADMEAGGDKPGPLTLHRESADALDDAIISAFSGSGIPGPIDVPGHRGSGVGMVTKNVADGRRLDAGHLFLRPVMDSGRVEVRGNTRATRLVINAGVVTGVEVVGPGGLTDEIAADRVVVCAGAVSTALLLMRSGIGPRDVLEAAGVECVVEAPMVGSRFRDHPSITAEFYPTDLYLNQVTGKPPFSTVATWHVGDAVIEVLPASRPLPELLGISGGEMAPVSWLVSLLTPQSRGRITLSPDDPFGEPLIYYNYLDSPHDADALRAGYSRVWEVLTSEVMSPWVDRAPEPAPVEGVREWLVDKLGTSYHTTSTVPAGPVGVGAVDAYGMVYGVAELQVADVSILPSGPTRGPSYLAMLLGWRLGSASVTEPGR